MQNKPLQRRCRLAGSGPTVHDEEFSFISKDGLEEVKLHNAWIGPDGYSITVVWAKKSDKNPIGQAKYERVNTWANGLRRVANIIEGRVSFLDFATQPSQKPGVL